jgi:hypothetical protein
MERFIITEQTCTIGFYEHVKLNICKPIEDQLNRRKLISRTYRTKGSIDGLKKIIENNSSLRISFGWSFESSAQYKRMMEECMEEVGPHYNMFLGTMASDGRCDWLGFLPFNTFDKLMYEDLGIYGMIIFNNELIDFQTDVVKFISEYKLFKQHSLLRNSDYRFDYYKSIRNNVDELAEAFHYFVDSIKDTVNIETIPRQYIEEQIGCHYLYHPDIFFELLEFYKLKGVIYE